MKCALISILLVGWIYWIQSSLYHWIWSEVVPSHCRQSAVRILEQTQVVAAVHPTLSISETQRPTPFKQLTYATSKLESFVSKIAVNNTIMTTVTDFGYLGHMLTFYAMSHLERYPNFFVTALDRDAYHV